MLRFLKKLVMFRLGQKSARGAAKLIGLGRLSLVIGLLGGIKALKRHRHA